MESFQLPFSVLEMYPAILRIIHSIGPLAHILPHSSPKNNTVEIYFYSIVFTLHINIEKLSLPKWRGNRIIRRELLVDSIFIPPFYGE